MASLLNIKSSQPAGGHAKRHEFLLAAPQASCVQLVGDFTHWQRAPINLARGADSLWHTEVELEPGPHRYRFLVDGEWRDDPQCSKREPNPFGSEDDICDVN